MKTYTISIAKHTFFLDILNNEYIDYLVETSKVKSDCYDITVNDRDTNAIESDEDYEYCIS